MEQYEGAGGPNDKYSIKNMLFTRAIPIYNIPVPTAGHKVYGCIDCGDKFILESSLKYHTERKTVKITYFCRHCDSPQTFYNRCNMLCHIRSHGFKTATINLTDLKVSPLPFEQPLPIAVKRTCNETEKKDERKRKREEELKGGHRNNCFDCGLPLTPADATINNLRSRLLHYQNGSEQSLNTCPVCSSVFKTFCAFKAHLRIHLRIPPYYCPDCGLYLGPSLPFPSNHSCPSFDKMRAATRVKCPIPECSLIHPSEYKDHVKNNHLRTVYKCNSCYVACFDERIILNHIKSAHKFDNTPLSAYYQCQLCPGKLIVKSQIAKHLDGHTNSTTSAYVCWICDQHFTSLSSLFDHHTEHDNSVKKIHDSVLRASNRNQPKIACKPTVNNKIYRVIKKCEQCKRSFTYKCKYEEIEFLPNECPYQCTFASSSNANPKSLLIKNKEIICFECKKRISQNWQDIKDHFNELHKTIRCVDVVVKIPIMKDVEKYIIKTKDNSQRKLNKKKLRKSKRKNDWKISSLLPDESLSESKNTDEFTCKKCGVPSLNRESFEIHLLLHRDPCMAYQCMECGECFVVKPSFTKHLLIKHGISNVEDYIFEKKCFNQKALEKHHDLPAVDEPVHENQCKICREQFENSTELEKHFRVHGMAFLMKNNRNNSP